MTRFRLLAAALAGLVLAACQSGGMSGGMAGGAPSGLQTVVRTDAGYVAGFNGPVRTYKGIPYAAPPVGALRFRPPQPAAHWEGVRLATTFGPQCLQGRAPSPAASEDCLTLNVWTGAVSAAEKRPVFVWIHGGAYESGAGSLDVYNGEALAAEGIVVVTINYRMGIFGFLAHPELSAESAEGVSGNQAILDMIASLQWVKANIAAFGGDPTNVTIGGESAGGTSMGLLILSPKAKSLFTKAIAASPWGFFQPTAHLKQTWYGKPSGESVGAKMGTLAELRAMPIDKLMTLPRPNGSTGHQVVDGVVIPDDPTTLWQKGQVNTAKLIVGTNRDEGSIFARPANTLADAKTAVNAGVAPGADALLPLYGGTSDATANLATRQMTGDVLFLMGGREMARTMSKTAAAWQYELTRVNPAAARASLGAFHGSDIPMWFHNLPQFPYVAARLGPLKPDDLGPIDDRIAHEMNGYIVNFMKTGDPNGPGLPAWPKFGDASSGGGERYIEFGDVTTVKSDLRKPQVDALKAMHMEMLAKR